MAGMCLIDELKLKERLAKIKVHEVDLPEGTYCLISKDNLQALVDLCLRRDNHSKDVPTKEETDKCEGCGHMGTLSDERCSECSRNWEDRYYQDDKERLR